MKKISSDFIFTIVIGLIFLLLIGLNGDNYLSVFMTIVDTDTYDNSDIQIEEIVTDTLKENFASRDGFIDLYGLTKKLLGERIIGNYEYFIDEIGMLQYSVSPIKGENFISSMKEMSELFKERNVPCIKINLPDRGEFFTASGESYYIGKTYSEIETQLENFNIDLINVKEEIIDASILPFEQFWLRTDAHATTKAEFYIAKLLTDYLADNYSLKFPDTDNVYNENMYDWTNYDFCGNLGDACGRFYMELDDFQIFVPKFDTKMKLTIPGELTKEGYFSEVMTNGYDGNMDSPYWVTNYGQWPHVYYEYDNLNYPDAPRLLVVCDSVFMRANVFLALNASHITVFDPRYIEGNEYVMDCLRDSEYDAVLICSSNYFNDVLLPYDISLPDKVITPYEGYQGMHLDYINNNNVQENEFEIGKSMISNNEIVFIIGWAADFTVNQPLQNLYLKVGGHIVKCKYGIERTYISDYFGIDSIKNSGFEVRFPKSWLDDVDTLEFIQIGCDGTYRFKTVEFRLTE